MAHTIGDRQVYIPREVPAQPQVPAVQPPPANVPPAQPQETLHPVAPQDTLGSIGTLYGVTPDRIAERNLLTSDTLDPGTTLVVPTGIEHPQPATPAATPEEAAVDTALQANLLARDNLAAMQGTSGQNGGQPWPADVIAAQQTLVDDTGTALQTAVDDQIVSSITAAGQPVNAATIQQFGDALAQRYANDPAAQAIIGQEVVDVRVDHEVDAALTAADSAPSGANPDNLSDAQLTVNTLSAALPTLSPEAQTALLASPRFDTLIDNRIAPSFTGPLQGEPWETSNNGQAEVRESIQSLQSLIQGADPRLAIDLTNRLLTAIEDTRTRALNDGSELMVGMEGTRSLEHVASQVGGTPAGDALVQRMAQLPLNGLTIGQGVAEGASPDLILAVAANGGGERMYQQALDGVRQFQSSIEDNANAYVEHIEELNYLIANAGTAAAPGALETAIDNYVAGKGPEWQQQLETLQNQLAADGARLIDQTAALNAAIAGMPADQQAAFRGDAAAILQDPQSQLAVTTALRQQPELARGAQGQRLIDTLAGLGITGGGNVLATTATAAYLRENVLAPSANLDFTNAGSLAQARDALNTALRDNPALAQVMGVTPEQLDGVVDSLLELIPTTPQSVEAASATNNIARNLNNTLDKIDGALGRSTPFSVQFRTSALGIVSAGLVNSVGNFADNPTLRNGLQVMVDGARVGVDGAQFVTALTNNTSGSPLVNGLKTAGKAVHILGAGLAGIDALGRLSQGDLVGAGLNAAVAGGVGYAVFGASAWAGPIGFGVATVATLGLFVYDSINASQQNSRFETAAAERFLDDVGFDAEAAAVLRNQSGESYSPVPLLMRYGESHGLDRQQTAEWINNLPPAALERLRDVAHVYLDEHDGNIAGFAGTAPGDAEQLADIQQALDRRLPLPPGSPDPLQSEPWLLGLENVTVPQSAAVLDRFMELWQLPRPGQP